MARDPGKPVERSASALLPQVEYPITRDELAMAAAEADLGRDDINLFHFLPDRTYQSPTDVMRQFAEAEARFALGRKDVRHRGDLGREAVETGANSTRHP